MEQSCRSVAIVMPCLNEENTLQQACASLGFGRDGFPAPRSQVLILVDNGSDDETLAVANHIAEHSTHGSVLVCVEEERGHLPARSRGVTVAANESGTQFIVQADADTEYQPGYAAALWASAQQFGLGTLVEGMMMWPAAAIAEISVLEQLLGDFDSSTMNTQQLVNFDVVVDDKCCGYWLDDYLKWGGHRREYWSSGEEMLAETTRLFMRGVARGANRFTVEAASARHSVRNWERNVLLEIASAGFPMPASWQVKWGGADKIPYTYRTLNASQQEKWDEALEMRQKMLTALFRTLPNMVEAVVPRSALDGAHFDVGLNQAIETVLAVRPAIIIEKAMQSAGVL